MTRMTTEPEDDRDVRDADTPPTAVATKLAALGWSSLHQVADGGGGIAVFRLECHRVPHCTATRRLAPTRKGARLPDDWGPAHQCAPPPAADPTAEARGAPAPAAPSVHPMAAAMARPPEGP